MKTITITSLRNAPKGALMLCACGAEYSANPSDYFGAVGDIGRCECGKQCALVTKHIVFKSIGGAR